MYFLKTKKDTVSATKKFIADTAPPPNGWIKSLRSDNGSEFKSNDFQRLLCDIRYETSAPNSPHQNGTAERNWRTLFEMD